MVKRKILELDDISQEITSDEHDPAFDPSFCNYYLDFIDGKL